MNANNTLKVKHPLKPQTPLPSNDSAMEEAVEALQQAATGTKRHPELVVEQEIFSETPRDESVCGSGWSFAELLNEFNER